MSSHGVNCTDLLASLLQSDINLPTRNLESNESANTTTLYMNEDFGAFIGFKLLSNHSPFWRGFLIIALCILSYSVLFSCIYFRCHLAKQKRIGLRVLEDRGLLTRRKWLLLLDQYTDGQQVISNLIAEYANPRVIDNLEDFLTPQPTPLPSRCSKYSRSITCKSIIYLLVLFTVGTVLYVMYIPPFMMGVFVRHSVEHYLRTECTYSWVEVNSYTFKNVTMSINVEALCSESTKMDVIPYTFTLEEPCVQPDYHDAECYINDETFEVWSRSKLKHQFSAELRVFKTNFLTDPGSNLLENHGSVVVSSSVSMP